MLRMFWVSCVLASLALTASFEAYVVQAGPTSGGRSYQYRVGGSSSTPATAPAGDFALASTPELVLYAYYAAEVKSAASGEEESESAGPSAARIELTVPASAEVWLDGHKSSQTGSARSFVTPALQQGKTFTYDLRVRWTTASGVVMDVTRAIHVKANRQTNVGFKQ